MLRLFLLYMLLDPHQWLEQVLEMGSQAPPTPPRRCVSVVRLSGKSRKLRQEQSSYGTVLLSGMFLCAILSRVRAMPREGQGPCLNHTAVF